MKILFMGTPDFALESLKALCERTEHEIVGVITQPDKPRGRGYTLTPPPVKVYATEHGIPVFQPGTLRDEAFAELLARLDPELIAVAAYGKILPKNVLDYPKFGCVNVHGSLLPKYRGAAPIQRAIIEGERVTGITTMYMAEGLDTGDMLLRKEYRIGENDDFEVVHDRLAEIGGELLIETISGLENGTITPTPQSEEGASYAPKITKEDCFIDFDLDSPEVHDRIRGLSPVPVAFTHTPDGKVLKILKSEVCEHDEHYAVPGTVLSLDGGKIRVACLHGSVNLLTVIPEGKSKMSAADFIRGRKIAVGDVLH